MFNNHVAPSCDSTVIRAVLGILRVGRERELGGWMMDGWKGSVLEGMVQDACSVHQVT